VRQTSSSVATFLTAKKRQPKVSPQLTTSDQALALELEAQEWSMDQPGFAERIHEIQTSLAARKSR
jgi:hypothetical protein